MLFFKTSPSNEAAAEAYCCSNHISNSPAVDMAFVQKLAKAYYQYYRDALKMREKSPEKCNEEFRMLRQELSYDTQFLLRCGYESHETELPSNFLEECTETAIEVDRVAMQAVLDLN